MLSRQQRELERQADVVTLAPRSISAIASDILKAWTKVYFGAVPYLEAMLTIDKITDMYYQDSAESIVRYFLGNATTFKGEDARKLKEELKALLKK